MNRWILFIAALVWVLAPLHLHAHDDADDGAGGSICAVCQLAQEHSPALPYAIGVIPQQCWTDPPIAASRRGHTHSVARLRPPLRGPPKIS
jgi:hypothetical protein